MKEIIDFSKILRKGKSNGISAGRLKYWIHAKNTREVRIHINRARISGQLICSGNTGYYLPENAKEIEEFIKREENTARSIFATLKTARKALKEMKD